MRRRANLLQLASRPGRHEHHLVVVARCGDAQIELATASEPLYFAHVNVSDELALALPTGDPMVDAFPLRTFLSDPKTGEDVARYNHHVGDLVLHPLGWMHWPGRLRPPFEPLPIPEDMLRCAVSLVFCASKPTPSTTPVFVSRGREPDAKAYAAKPPPLAHLDVMREPEKVVARVGSASLRLVVHPAEVQAPRGAYVVILSGSGPYESCDMVYVPPGEALDGAGIERALVFDSDVLVVSPPPPSWDAVPQAPMSPFTEATRSALPVTVHGITARDADATRVTVEVNGTSARVPRHWLARMLFRVALHAPNLGYVETYGGFFYDDRGGEVQMGIRGAAPVVLSSEDALATVEALYRAVAPDGYRER